ncbi:CPBP family intramembrane glutamic endopeptidase [Roseateles sp. UC29_93]|uniref:CPBP family intramembrane glutamic endopeptidase n=1 Tax=Roseateles sp. UC29_93 TaxID=3350177 RepID=UPI00366CB989
MSELSARLFHQTSVFRKLLHIARWVPFLIVAVALRNWPEFIEGPHLWSIFDFGYRGEFRLFLNIELTLSGLALLAVFVRWDASPKWCQLLRPQLPLSLTLVAATLVLVAVMTFVVNPEAIHSAFRPVNPVTHFPSWSISVLALLLGAFQQEIWNRAILQSTLTRMSGNRWIGLGFTVILLVMDQHGHRVETPCSAVLLGIVFMHTRSLLCTTAIRVALDLSLGILQGGTFMVASFLTPSEFMGTKALVVLSLLLLAVGVELRYRRSPRLLQLTQASAKSLALMFFAYVLFKLTGRLLAPAWRSVIDINEWMTRGLVTRMDLLIQAVVPVIALAALGKGPRLRELLAVRPKATFGLAVVAAAVPFLAASIAVPDAFRAGFFAPLSPFTTSPHFWLGAVLPLFVAALQEEVVHRALVQPLLSRLFRSEWVGVVTSALHFAAFHPLESAVFVIPGGLLFAVVFMRTRSIVCTTALHLTLNIALSLINSTKFTLALFIPSDVLAGAAPLIGALVLALAVAFEWWWRMAAEANARRLGSPPNERAATCGIAPTSA